jgi:ribonuclease D
VVERELGLELDKTLQSVDWGGTLTPEMIEYAAKDVEVLLPLYEVLKAKIEEVDLPTLQRSSTEAYRLWSG